MHNVFGAYKVTYFNACREYCEQVGADWRKVHTGVLLSGYINDPHTYVPGPDGKCFPKDVNTFAKMTDGTPLGILLEHLYELNVYFRGVGGIFKIKGCASCASPFQLPSGWEVVVTMRVAFSNSTIPSVNEEFRTLASGNLPGACYRFRLSVIKTSISLITFTFDAPLTVNWNNMLVFAHRYYTSFLC